MKFRLHTVILFHQVAGSSASSVVFAVGKQRCREYGQDIPGRMNLKSVRIVQAPFFSLYDATVPTSVLYSYHRKSRDLSHTYKPSTD